MRALILVPGTALLLAGCAARAAQETPRPDPYSQALAALTNGAHASAVDRLRAIASKCDSGDNGLVSTLLLAGLELDPRNPDRDPDLAAAYAAHVLAVPNLDAETLYLAQVLHLMALELGAAPPPVRVPTVTAVGLRQPHAGAFPDPSPAPRFSACRESEVPAGVGRIPPAHPGRPLALEVAQRTAQVDTLVVRVGAANSRADAVVSERDELRREVEALEAELARIRRLLRGGG